MKEKYLNGYMKKEFTGKALSKYLHLKNTGLFSLSY